MIDFRQAENFAEHWIEVWNRRDLVAILGHYAEDIIFHSPRISILSQSDQLHVKGKKALADYWTKSLATAKDLHFKLQQVYVGSDSITITYRNHRNQDAAETFRFDEYGLVVQSIATYRNAIT